MLEQLAPESMLEALNMYSELPLGASDFYFTPHTNSARLSLLDSLVMVLLSANCPQVLWLVGTMRIQSRGKKLLMTQPKLTLSAPEWPDPFTTT